MPFLFRPLQRKSSRGGSRRRVPFQPSSKKKEGAFAPSFAPSEIMRIALFRDVSLLHNIPH